MGKIDFDKFIVDWLESKYALEQNRVADALKKQGLKIVNGAIMPIEQQKEPKFKVGDKIRRKTPRRYDKDMQVARVESNYYLCNHLGQFSSESIFFSEESNYELVEQKPADKIESKFKVGDWIVTDGGKANQVVAIDDDCDGFTLDDDTYFSGSWKDMYHLWTIQDAKAGDVLADGNLPFIFKRMDSMQRTYAYCGVSGYGDFKVKSDGEMGEWTWMHDLTPATHEQREALFSAMHEAGYEWNAEELKLEKIEPKPAWSEWDESMLMNIIEDENCPLDSETMSWLKSLKERYAWKPSEEQIEVLTWCKPLFYDPKSKGILESLIDDLKKLM